MTEHEKLREDILHTERILFWGVKNAQVAKEYRDRLDMLKTKLKEIYND